MKTIVLTFEKMNRSIIAMAILGIIMLASTQQTIAQTWNKGMLRIREDRGRSISVTIDGRKFPKVSRNLSVGDLPAGRHNIKIFRYNSNGYGYSNGIVIYNGFITVKPRSIYYVTAYNGSIDIEENCCIDDYGHWNHNDNWENWDDENNSWNNNKNWVKIDESNGRARWNNEHDNDWNTKNDNDNWNNQNKDNWKRNDNYDYNDPNWNGYRGCMSEGRFQQIIEQMRKNSFEKSKVNIANQAIKNDKITVNQLIAILNELSFESSKLLFAKDNYNSVVDKQNYFKVNEVFTFESSRDELNNFLNSKN